MSVLESDVGSGKLLDGDLQPRRLHPDGVVGVVEDGEDGLGGALQAGRQVEAALARTPERAVLLLQEDLRRHLHVSNLNNIDRITSLLYFIIRIKISN